MASYKSTVAAFVCIGLAVVNIQSLLFPILASYGGQWAAAHKGGQFGWGDLAFYPQTKLFPFDVILYVVGVAALFGLVFKSLPKMQSMKLLKIYIALALLPLVWAILNFAGGFNYSKCHIPSQYYTCTNPAGRIWQRLILHAATVVVTLGLVIVAKKINQPKATS